MDTCLPCGSRHGSQNFQHISNAVRFALHQRGFPVVNYIDDFVGFGTPDVARHSFDCLCDLLQRLGLTISKKKLIHPCTDVCLGVHINTENDTISIPDEKLTQIKENVTTWLAKTKCTKSQLQSLLGQLLYVHKCIRPARAFLNRMLDLLRRNHGQKHINFTHSFRRDVRWFDSFLLNGVSMYNHRHVDYHVTLDTCPEGLGGVWKNYVYHLPIPRHYLNLGIVHLEMGNIVADL